MTALAEVDTARRELDRALALLEEEVAGRGTRSMDVTIAATAAVRAALEVVAALRRVASGEFSGVREVIVERPGRRRDLAEFLREERRRR
jgi:hypothetical protein